MAHDPQDHDHHHHHDHDHHGHTHSHAHDLAPLTAHAPPAADEKVHAYHQLLGLALKELLIEKGVFTAEDIRKAIEFRDTITPAMGAKIVARAWTDPAYKKRLLADGTAAIKEFGHDMGALHLVVVENTPDVHNVIVCTLCSCYPRAILGLAALLVQEPRIPRPRRARAARRAAGNSAPPSPTAWRCACTIPPPTCAISCCRCAPKARKSSAKPNSPRSSRATA